MTTMYQGSAPPHTNNNAGIFATVVGVGAAIGASIFGVSELFDTDYVDAVVEAGNAIGEAGEIASNQPMQQIFNAVGGEGAFSFGERISNGIQTAYETAIDTVVDFSVFGPNGDLSHAEFTAQLSEALSSYDIDSISTIPELQSALQDTEKAEAISTFLNDNKQATLQLEGENLKLVKLKHGEALGIVDLEKTKFLNEENNSLLNRMLYGVSQDDINQLRSKSTDMLQDMPSALLTGAAAGAGTGLAMAGASKVLLPDTKIAEAQYQQALSEGRQLGIS
jgi:hypothetical protein